MINIDFSAGVSRIVIGRNTLTGLDIAGVDHVECISREHAEITQIDDKIYITSKSKQGLVWKDNLRLPIDFPVEITWGDRISLIGPMSRFNHEVRDNYIDPAEIAQFFRSGKSPILRIQPKY